jgi:adenylylsulfate kinase
MYLDRPNPINKIIKTRKAGRVVWITGLSGAGKSVLAAALVARLRMIDDEILLLDGDELRKVFGATPVNSQNYGRDKRMAC